MLVGEGKLPIKIIGNTGTETGFMPTCSRGSVGSFMIDTAELDR